MKQTGYRIALAIGAGLLNVCIFPRLEWSALAFVCLVPLFFLQPAEGEKPVTGRYYYLAGVVFHFGNLYWIYHVIQHYTSLNPVLVAGILLGLCLLLAIFWGVYGWILGRVTVRFGFEKAMWLAPFLWVALERGKNWMQFPWCLLGYSQYANLRLAQLASIAGVYGLSFLLVTANAAIALAIKQRKYYYVYSTMAVVLCVVFYGHFRIQQPVSGETLRVACVQGNIPEDVKLDYNFADQVNQTHIKMTRDLVAKGKPDIVFWTEASTLFPLRSGGIWTKQLLDLAREENVPILVGSDAFEKERIFNSAYLISNKGEIGPDYSKIYLVPFGEFVPFSSILFFAGKVVPEISDFTAGYKYTQFPLKGKSFAVNICFEVVFPQLARRLVRGGSSLLVTITNDAWFGNSSAPYQHFAMAAMRSIENRRYLVRAANTGISGIVDPYGRILQRTDIFVPATVRGEVKWVDEQTFYTKHGDWIVWVSVVISLVAAAAAFIAKGEKRGSRIEAVV